MDTVLFCRVCGSFRDIVNSGGGVVTCPTCYDKVHITDLNAHIRGKAEIIPIERSELLLALSGRKPPEEDAPQATIDEECPKCGEKGLSYRTAQLRGIDEGQTIFYSCLNKKCKHRFTVNS